MSESWRADPDGREVAGGPREQGAIRTVLAATDFSAGADVAVRRAFMLARQHCARITVAHVAPTGASAQMEETAQRNLRRLVEGAGVSADTLLTTGSAGEQLASEAERLGADVVVVGAHGAHWLRDVFLGSTAELLVGFSRVPVLLAKRPGGDDYSSVLLAVEASGDSFRAAQAGLTLAPAARHVVAHAVSVLGENLLRLNGADDDTIGELRRGQIAEVRPHIERLARRLMPVPNEIVVRPDRPETLVSTLAGFPAVELLVVGVEHSAGLRRALVGSVSRHAMQRAPCDVIVVPLRPASARTGSEA